MTQVPHTMPDDPGAYVCGVRGEERHVDRRDWEKMRDYALRVRAETIEECAKVCDKIQERDIWSFASRGCAFAIRALAKAS